MLDYKKCDDNKLSRNLTAFDKEITVLKEIGERIVLCLDEFEGLFEDAKEFNNAFFNHFRTMVNHRRLALVTASRKPLEIYSLEKDEAKATELSRFKGLKLVAPTLVFTLEKLGWIRGAAMDGGVCCFAMFFS